MGGMMAGMGLWMILWALVGVVILALAVAGAVWAARQLGQRANGDHERAELPGDGPREILRHRYAAGEIDEDEYLRRGPGGCPRRPGPRRPAPRAAPRGQRAGGAARPP